MEKRVIAPFLLVFLFLLMPASPSYPEPEEDSKYPDVRLKPGDTVASLHFEDVYGNKFTNEEYYDWIIIYTFADRLSNKALRSIIGPAGLEVEKAHPNLKLLYLGFADLMVVPTMFSEMVTPILQMIMNKSNQDLEEAHKIWRVPLNTERARFFMIPDYTGHYIRSFGLENAKEYHVFIVYKRKVHATFDSFNPPYVDYYMPVFDKLAKFIASERSDSSPRSSE